MGQLVPVLPLLSLGVPLVAWYNGCYIAYEKIKKKKKLEKKNVYVDDMVCCDWNNITFIWVYK